MSQTQTLKSAKQQTTSQRVIFSDSNRAQHLQAFFEWLPENLCDVPLIDWTQLPSKAIGYFVNVVGDSPFAASLAIAAGTGVGSMKAYSLWQAMMRLYRLLRGVQTLCGVQSLTELTSSIWETYVIRKNLTPGDYSYFKTYAVFTERYLPDYLERLNSHQYARLEPYILPQLPRKFRERHLPGKTYSEGQNQRRKEKSDIIAPLHSTLVALVRFRKQSAQRLLSAYREAQERAKAASVELPLSFSYQEELVMVNRDAQTVADICLEKRSVTMRFLLWDRRSWVKKHKDDYGDSIPRRANLGTKEVVKAQFFVQCLNPVEELLWFGDLIKYRLFQQGNPQNITPEDSQQRRQLLSQLGTVQGLTCTRDGILMPGNDLTIFISKAIALTSALLFDAEALCRGALFASALVTIALTNGSRMCELLQVSADRFKVRPYAAQKDRNSAKEERVMHLQLLLPKGRRTEAERKLFPISDWSWELLCEIAQELRRAHDNHIPVVHPHVKNTKVEDLSPERYLFQWDASPDGKLGTFTPDDVTNLLRFILYGLEFRTREGEPFSVSAHLLRHVMANAARHEHAVPVEAVARALHHEQKQGMIPSATLYYSQETEEQSLGVFAQFQTDLEEWATSLLVELPDEQEVAGMEDNLRESFERWHTLLETTLGFCGNPDLCPRGYNRTLCVGCPHLVVDPRKRKNAVHWRNAYAQYVLDLEEKGCTVDARQARLHVQDLERHINEMDVLQEAIEDGRRKPVFLMLPSTPYEEVIVDAQA